MKDSRMATEHDPDSCSLTTLNRHYTRDGRPARRTVATRPQPRPQPARVRCPRAVLYWAFFLGAVCAGHYLLVSLGFAH